MQKIVSRRFYAAASNLAPFTSKPPRVLVTGALGQIGTELVPAMAARYGVGNIVGTDVRLPGAGGFAGGRFYLLDVADQATMRRIVEQEKIDWIVHNASVLSASGELEGGFEVAMSVNIRGVENVLEAARARKLRVFAPSSIAAFGASTPPDNVPDLVVQRPSTIYGVSKVYVELLGEYYARRFGVDFRSVRYPGIISNVAPPGGGTTDYAVDIYYKAIETGRFSCFLKEDSVLPMLYMPDCLDGTLQLLEADPEKVKQRVYNLTAMSFTPAELAASIQKILPEFKIEYKPDAIRQRIADSWPHSLDDSNARRDWGFAPKYDLLAMTKDMLNVLSKRLTKK